MIKMFYLVVQEEEEVEQVVLVEEEVEEPMLESHLHLLQTHHQTSPL